MKKLLVAVLLVICAATAVIGGKYVYDSGLLKKYPDPEYLSKSEEKNSPFYSELSKEEKDVYTALKRGAEKHKTNIDLPHEVDGDTYSMLYCMLEKQEPQLFYLDSVYYTADKVRDAELLYRADKDEYEDMIEDFQDAELDAVDEALEGDDDYEKALAIHDYLIKNCEYIREDDDGYSSTAYGCLVEGEANCEGYAKAFDLIAGDVGLKSVVIVGKTDDGENHAWNQVDIEGDWYNIDVTWDDPDKPNVLLRNYFLCDDDQFSRTHTPSKDAAQPFECDADEYNYYVYNDLYAESMDEADDVVREQIEDGATTVVVRLSDKKLYKKFREKYIEDKYYFDVIAEVSPWDDDAVTVSTTENDKEYIIAALLSYD